jgi:hypothetical protein
MKEKAIASTAVTEDEHSDRGEEFEFEFGKRRVASTGGGCAIPKVGRSGIGRRVVLHARKISGSLRDGSDFTW